MRHRGYRGHFLSVLAFAVFVGALSLALTTSSQPAHETYRAPRSADDKPDLNGIWQALGTAHWDIEGHAARPGPILELGALGAIPAGMGVVRGWWKFPISRGRKRKRKRTSRIG